MRKQLTALLAVAATACSGWVEGRGRLSSTPAEPTDPSSAIRVTLKDGSSVYLLGARTKGDSVVGYTRDGMPDFVRRAVATKDIASVSRYGIDNVKTGLVVLAIVGSIAGLALACASGPPI